MAIGMVRARTRSFIGARMVAPTMAAKQGAKPQNRPMAPRAVPLRQVAYDAALWAGIGAILLSTAQGATPSRWPHVSTVMTYSATQAEFASTLATIRADLYSLAMAHDKPERSALMKAAAALALFESDTLRKAAGPILPGESPTL